MYENGNKNAFAPMSIIKNQNFKYFGCIHRCGIIYIMKKTGEARFLFQRFWRLIIFWTGCKGVTIVNILILIHVAILHRLNCSRYIDFRQKNTDRQMDGHGFEVHSRKHVAAQNASNRKFKNGLCFQHALPFVVDVWFIKNKIYCIFSITLNTVNRWILSIMN